MDNTEQQVPETKNETTGKEESKETKQILLTEYQAKLHAEWEATHKGQAAPIMVDRDGNARWVNRAERRRMASQARKAAKRLRK
jgi:hypothetical protein